MLAARDGRTFVELFVGKFGTSHVTSLPLGRKKVMQGRLANRHSEHGPCV